MSAVDDVSAPHGGAHSPSESLAELLAPLTIDVDPNEVDHSIDAIPGSFRVLSHFSHPAIHRTLLGAEPGQSPIQPDVPSGLELGRAAINAARYQLALHAAKRRADRILVLQGPDAPGASQEQAFSASTSGSTSTTTSRETLFAAAARSVASRFGHSPQSDVALLQELQDENVVVLRRAAAFWTRLPFPVLLGLGVASGKMDVDVDEW